MGLDNSLEIKGKTIKAKQFLIDHCKYLSHDDFGEEYTFGYWRKCWNIRHKFLEVFHKKGYDGQGGEIKLDISDLVHCREIMKYFLKEENWEVDGSSIWSWSESVVGIAKCLANINFFIEDFLEEYDEKKEIFADDFELVFVDSY